MTNDTPDDSPVWDMRYAYAGGVRVLKSVKDSSGVERHTLEIFGTMRSEETQFNVPGWTEDYAINLTGLHVYVGGMGHVLWDDTLPQAPNSAGELHMLLAIPDQLGSTSIAIDAASSEVVERATHQAYGAIESDYRPERWDGQRERYKFTGKEEDIEVGLVYFGARYYAPRLNRWASPDPLSIHVFDGDLNPYAYVRGRVSRSTDRLGLDDAGSVGDVGASIPDCPDPCEVVVNGQRPPRPEEKVDPWPVFAPAPDPRITVSMRQDHSSGGGVPTVNVSSDWRILPFSRRDLLADVYPELARNIRGAEREEAFIHEVAPAILYHLIGMGLSGALAADAMRGGPLSGRGFELMEGGTGRAIVGHGSDGGIAGKMTVPNGTTLTTWTRDGLGIPNAMGLLIEQGDYDTVGALFSKEVEGAASWLPGAEIPNYTVSPLDDLQMSNSIRVWRATPLSDIAQPGMGHIDCAFCLY